MKKVLILLFFIFSSFAFAFEDINKQNFEEKVAKGKVIVDFYATW